jgi:hypothetical protein
MKKLLSQSSYNSSARLKGLGSRHLLVGSHEYNSALRLTSKESQNQNVLTAKFDELNFDRINCLYYLQSATTGNKLSVVTPVFRCYFINQDYSEVFIGSEVGTLTPVGWQCSFLLSLLAPNFIEGQAAIKITVETKRLDEKIKASVYLNHLGVYDSIIRLRNDVDYLDITKLDE